MDVEHAVITHCLEVEVFEDVERLKHSRTLRPAGELVNFYTLVRRLDRFFDSDFPVGEILFGNEAAFLLSAARQFAGNVALIKTVVGGIDGFLPILARSERLLLG